MTYGVYFFKGNGQVVPATRQMYHAVALGISNMTDACAARDGFRALHPGQRWIAASEKFDNVQYGFRTATVDELREAHEARMARRAAAAADLSARCGGTAR